MPESGEAKDQAADLVLVFVRLADHRVQEDQEHSGLQTWAAVLDLKGAIENLKSPKINWRASKEVVIVIAKQDFDENKEVYENVPVIALDETNLYDELRHDECTEGSA